MTGFSIQFCSYGEHICGNHEDNRNRRNRRATKAHQDDCRSGALRQSAAPKLWRKCLYAEPWIQDYPGQPCLIKGSLGEKAVASLAEVEEKIDMVDVFRRSEYVPDLVDEAIRLKVPAIWLQEDVIHEEAAEKARKAGIFVVMDKCILKEHRRRFS